MIRHDPLVPGLDFFTGFVISGTLRGADATSSPDEVTAQDGSAVVARTEEAVRDAMGR